MHPCWKTGQVLETWKINRKTYFGRLEKLKLGISMDDICCEEIFFLCENFIQKWQTSGACALRDMTFAIQCRCTWNLSYFALEVSSLTPCLPFNCVFEIASISHNWSNMCMNIVCLWSAPYKSCNALFRFIFHMGVQLSSRLHLLHLLMVSVIIWSQ